MGRKHGSGNEFGDYLPDDEARLQEGHESIRARDDDKAKELCKDTADEYGGINPRIKRGKKGGDYDCSFDFWG